MPTMFGSPPLKIFLDPPMCMVQKFVRDNYIERSMYKILTNINMISSCKRERLAGSLFVKIC